MGRRKVADQGRGPFIPNEAAIDASLAGDWSCESISMNAMLRQERLWTRCLGIEHHFDGAVKL